VVASGILVGVPAVDSRGPARPAARSARCARSGALGLTVALWALWALWARASAQTLSPAVTVSDFAPVTLSGAASPTTATMSDFSVSDTAGVGWNVTVTASQFHEFDAGAGQYVSGGRTLPVGSLSMVAPSVDPTSPSIAVADGPHAIDGATVKVVSAGSGTSGTWQFSHGGPLTLTVPASAYAVEYRSEITVAVASGP
jgi:hypothetical protein